MIQLFIQFIIIFLAVRLAISPLIPKTTELEKDENEVILVNLRDIGVFSNDELEDIIELYQNNSVKDNKKELYEKYLKVLNELKENGYFSHEVYLEKLEELNNHFYSQR